MLQERKKKKKFLKGQFTQIARRHVYSLTTTSSIIFDDIQSDIREQFCLLYKMTFR